jgi:hypothetical protein
MRDEPRTCNECGCELHEFDGPDADFCSLCLEDQKDSLRDRAADAWRERPEER